MYRVDFQAFLNNLEKGENSGIPCIHVTPGGLFLPLIIKEICLIICTDFIGLC